MVEKNNSDSKKIFPNDFLEIEFTGKTSEDKIFDSNIKEDFEKLFPSSKELPKPFIFSLGHGMFLNGIENFLIDKEIGKRYEIDLSPENAFGIRQQKLVQVMPTNIFSKQKQMPTAGMIFNFDGRLGKILSVSGGRVIVDFNHPLAGKNVKYNINVIRKIEDINEKVKSFIEFLFRKPLKFEVKDKIIIHLEGKEKELKQFIELFSEKFKEVFGMELEIMEVESKESKIK